MAFMELEKFVAIIVEKFRQEIIKVEVQLHTTDIQREPQINQNQGYTNRKHIKISQQHIKRQTLFNRTKCK